MFILAVALLIHCCLHPPMATRATKPQPSAIPNAAVPATNADNEQRTSMKMKMQATGSVLADSTVNCEQLCQSKLEALIGEMAFNFERAGTREAFERPAKGPSYKRPFVDLCESQPSVCFDNLRSTSLGRGNTSRSCGSSSSGRRTCNHAHHPHLSSCHCELDLELPSAHVTSEEGSSSRHTHAGGPSSSSSNRYPPSLSCTPNATCGRLSFSNPLNNWRCQAPREIAEQDYQRRKDIAESSKRRCIQRELVSRVAGERGIPYVLRPRQWAQSIYESTFPGDTSLDLRVALEMQALEYSHQLLRMENEYRIETNTLGFGRPRSRDDFLAPARDSAEMEQSFRQYTQSLDRFRALAFVRQHQPSRPAPKKFCDATPTHPHADPALDPDHPSLRLDSADGAQLSVVFNGSPDDIASVLTINENLHEAQSSGTIQAVDVLNVMRESGVQLFSDNPFAGTKPLDPIPEDPEDAASFVPVINQILLAASLYDCLSPVLTAMRDESNALLLSYGVRLPPLYSDTFSDPEDSTDDEDDAEAPAPAPSAAPSAAPGLADDEVQQLDPFL